MQIDSPRIIIRITLLHLNLPMNHPILFGLFNNLWCNSAIEVFICQSGRQQRVTLEDTGDPRHRPRNCNFARFLKQNIFEYLSEAPRNEANDLIWMIVSESIQVNDLLQWCANCNGYKPPETHCRASGELVEIPKCLTNCNRFSDLNMPNITRAKELCWRLHANYERQWLDVAGRLSYLKLEGVFPLRGVGFSTRWRCLSLPCGSRRCSGTHLHYAVRCMVYCNKP